MRRRGNPRNARVVGLAILLGGLLPAPTAAVADENGISFWLPGLFGSLAAVPQQPAPAPSKPMP